MAHSYYIYYRVTQPGEASAAVRRLQSAIRERLGIDGRLLRKRDEPSMWMEVYEDVGDAAGFESILAALVKDMDLSSILAAGSVRRAECFEDF